MTPAQRAERERAAAAANQKHRELKRGRHGARIELPIRDGCIVIFSDAHWWPHEESIANKALLYLLPKLKPWCVVNNGDSFDGASISRFPRIGWDSRPSVVEELKANEDRLGEIKDACKGLGVMWYIWNVGNHDARYETFLASRVPEYHGVSGFALKERFPDWLPAWSTWIGDQAVIKHRMKGGLYAAANNALHAGRTIVTSHDHALYYKAFTDYNGTRWGVDTGTLADVWGPQFKDYTEDHSVNWQSGFAILHFRDGKCTGPELVHALPDGRAVFRGELLNV